MGINSFNHQNAKFESGRIEDGTFQITDFDIEKYTVLSESLHDRPEHWRNLFVVFGTGEEHTNPVFDDPEGLFVKDGYYMLKGDSVKIYSNYKHFVGVKIQGTEGIYDSKLFTTSSRKTNEVDGDPDSDENTIDPPPPIYLENPPETEPEYWTEDYKALFKETAGNNYKIDPITGEKSKDEPFDYVGHIRYTRKPEQWPDWLKILVEAESKPSTAKLKKPKSAVETEKYFTSSKNPFA